MHYHSFQPFFLWSDKTCPQIFGLIHELGGHLYHSIKKKVEMNDSASRLSSTYINGESPERKPKTAQRVGRVQTECMENFPAKITKLSRGKKRDPDRDATNHSVKV